MKNIVYYLYFSICLSLSIVYHFLVIPESLEQKFKNRSRRCTKSQWIVLVGFDSRVIEYLDTSNLTRGWSRLTEIPGPGMRYGMSGAGLAAHNPSGQIFVVGGVGKGAILQAVSTVLAYDIKSNSWSRISSMNKVSPKYHLSQVKKSMKSINLKVI